MKFKQYLTEAADINKESVPKLLKALEKNAMKKVSKLPNTAPIVRQVIESIGKVRERMKPNMNLKGEQAVKEFFKACKGLFLANQPPLSTLIKKYPQLSQQINNVYFNDELIF